MAEEQELDMVTRANLAAERVERANAESKELLKKLQEIESQRILGGKSSAGTPTPEVPPETAKEYANRILRGGV